MLLHFCVLQTLNLINLKLFFSVYPGISCSQMPSTQCHTSTTTSTYIPAKCPGMCQKTLASLLSWQHFLLRLFFFNFSYFLILLKKNKTKENRKEELWLLASISRTGKKYIHMLELRKVRLSWLFASVRIDNWSVYIYKYISPPDLNL